MSIWDSDYAILHALSVLSAQVNHCERLLIYLLNHQQIVLPPELVQAGQDLANRKKDLQAALDNASLKAKQEGQ